MKPIAPPKPEKIKIPDPNDPLESKIEDKVREYAIKLGWYCRKFKSPNHRSVLDRLFISPYGRVVFIEFKRLRGKPTPNQTQEINELRKYRQTVHVVNSIEYGKSVIDKYSFEE